MIPLPQVKEWCPVSGQVDPAKFKKFRASGLNAYTLHKIGTLFPDLSVTLGKKGFFIEFSNVNGLMKAAEVANGFDAYVLQVSENGIRIDAKTAAGLFYGLQTLFQMLPQVPCGTVRDHAAVQYRMIHWDLKGYQPKLEVMLEELEILASYKVNAILLEIEDKYDYQCAPEVGCSTAYSFEDMRKISRLAADLHIMIVPKLQSVAHVDYILKHDRYKNLKENGHCYQYCTSNSKVDKLWNDMADELMECIAEHPQYFHIGADEASNLGECPKCKKLGKVGSYVRRVKLSIEHLLKAGRTPVMWDDILRNSQGMMTDDEARQCWHLGKQCVLMYWAYGYGGKRNFFPFIKTYQDAGLTVWGASGYSGCDNWAGSLPPLEHRGANANAWVKSARESKLPCICATGWGRIGSADCPSEPHESSWFTILYSAVAMWSGEPYDFTRFIYDLSVKLYGEIPEAELVAAILNISKNPYAIANLKGKEGSCDRLTFLRLAAAAESLNATELRLFCNWNEYYFGRLGKALEDYRVDYMERWPKVHADSIKEFKKQMDRSIRKFYGKFTADDFMNTRFGYLEKVIKDTAALTRKTKRI